MQGNLEAHPLHNLHHPPPPGPGTCLPGLAVSATTEKLDMPINRYLESLTVPSYEIIQARNNFITLT